MAILLNKALPISVLLLTILMLLGGCDSHSHSSRPNPGPEPTPEPLPEPTPEPIANPLVEHAVNIGNIALIGTAIDLGKFGYATSEYFLSGSAQAFTNTSELNENGYWDIEPGESADYKTRIVVYRPMEVENFNGTVIVEWFNVSSGFDTAADWAMGHTELLRSGYAYVGVSAQVIGIEGNGNSLLPLYPKAANPERYESLLLPGDSFSYDMFSQVAQSLRHPQELDPLGGLKPKQLIAVGLSQSANRMVTYVNAIHPVYQPYDGYLIHSRTISSAELSQNPQPYIPAPEIARVREDLNVPVLMLQTETDLFGLGSLSSRQGDSEMYRLWEVAGSSHSDLYALDGIGDEGTDPTIAAVTERANLVPGILECDLPINAGPVHWVVKAAISTLNKWVSDGVAPDTVNRLQTTDDGLGFDLDEWGNTLGGIRTPYVETPVATLSGAGQSGEGFCFVFGTTRLFDAATLSSLYTDGETYTRAIETTTDRAVKQGYILPADAELIKINARENPVL